MHLSLTSILAPLGAIACFGIDQMVPAQADPFKSTPHLAFYDINLLETRMGDITQVDGSMKVSITAQCDAWTIQSDLAMASGNGAGLGVELRVVHESKETVDRTSLEFETEVYVNGSQTELIKGVATRDATGKGEAVFDHPQRTVVPLPSGTVFPLDSVDRSMTEFFEQNTRLLNYLYFDGSEPAVDRVTDLLAGEANVIQPDQDDPDALLTQAPKRIVSTLFELNQADSEPQSTFISDIMPNGILTRLTIDLGFILVEARLNSVEARPSPSACP